MNTKEFKELIDSVYQEIPSNEKMGGNHDIETSVSFSLKNNDKYISLDFNKISIDRLPGCGCEYGFTFHLKSDNEELENIQKIIEERNEYKSKNSRLSRKIGNLPILVKNFLDSCIKKLGIEFAESRNLEKQCWEILDLCRTITYCIQNDEITPENDINKGNISSQEHQNEVKATNS